MGKKLKDIDLSDSKGVAAAKKATDDFKKFAFKGNIVDMAVGVVIGSAFTAIVNSLVADIITPFITLLTGNVNLIDKYMVIGHKELWTNGMTLADAQAAGVITVNFGSFVQAIVNFFLIAISVFIVVMILKKSNVKARKEEEALAAAEAEAAEKAAAEAAAKIKVCPYCKQEIPVDATRCPHCTSMLAE